MSESVFLVLFFTEQIWANASETYSKFDMFKVKNKTTNYCIKWNQSTVWNVLSSNRLNATY